MVFRVTLFRRFLEAWPGKRLLGNYRFLPIFFILGATVEFSMINWQVGETNFYRTFKKRKAAEIVENLEYRKIYPVPDFVFAEKSSESSSSPLSTSINTAPSNSSSTQS